MGACVASMLLVCIGGDLIDIRSLLISVRNRLV
jgi:hypothetical protein